MKNNLTTGTWQDDIWCPIIIIWLCTSDDGKPWHIKRVLSSMTTQTWKSSSMTSSARQSHFPWHWFTSSANFVSARLYQLSLSLQKSHFSAYGLVTTKKKLLKYVNFLHLLRWNWYQHSQLRPKLGEIKPIPPRRNSGHHGPRTAPPPMHMHIESMCAFLFDCHVFPHLAGPPWVGGPGSIV